MQTKTISTMQPLLGQTAGAAVALVVDNQGRRPKVLRVEGYMNGTANIAYYLMFFASATAAALANGNRPLLQLEVLGVDGFSFDFSDKGWDSFNSLANTPGAGNLVVHVSTTADTLTKATTQTATLEVQVEDFENPGQVALTAAGDTTTDVQLLQVWAQASGPKNLFDAIITESGGAVTYIQIYTTDALTANSLVFEKVIAIGATVRLSFGDNGFIPYTLTLAHVLSQGCTIVLSNTQGSNDGSGLAKVYARYF